MKFNNRKGHVRETPQNGGTQHVFRFQNGFGASVVCHNFSYGGEDGLWELAVIQYKSQDEDDWSLTYDTPITQDVEGYLTHSDVMGLLNKIEKLPIGVTNDGYEVQDL